jgi:acetyltransferase-like isoleucine patch superfamily enzyme
MSAAREAIKGTGRVAATIVMAPALLSFFVRAALFGQQRALLSSTQAIAWIPGLLGQYLRRAFLMRTLDHCAPTAVIEWGTTIADARTTIGDHAYIGPSCHIGYAHIARDVLIAPAVHIPSGGHSHGTKTLEAPLRDQAGALECVRIGENSWIGAAAVVMADVGAQTIVGAGAVVTSPLPDRVVAAGVPARVLRPR